MNITNKNNNVSANEPMNQPTAPVTNPSNPVDELNQLFGLDSLDQNPSKSSSPHLSRVQGKEEGYTQNTDCHIVDNQSINNKNNNNIAPNTTDYRKAEEMRFLREKGFSDTFSDKLNPGDLPQLVREAMETQSTPVEQDKIVIGSIVTMSGKMPNVNGRYGDNRLGPPLYLMFTGPSGVAEKGTINNCKQLLVPINRHLISIYEKQKAEYDMQMTKYESMPRSKKGEMQKPSEPIRRTVFIPADSSATNTYQCLSDNGGEGIIFETEADTLTNALKQDYGNYSDGLRKAFHHETISYGRRTEHEYVYIEKPRLAVLLTCTPGQVPLLLPANNVENGLANRFVYYIMRGYYGWRDPWANVDKVPLEDRLFAIGTRYQKLYNELLERNDNPLEFSLSQEQRQEFNQFFSPLYDEQIALFGEDISAFIYRLGVTAFRIAMTLTVLRCYENKDELNEKNKILVCSNKDFHTTLTIVNTLINHTAYVYNNLLPHPALVNPQVAAMLPQEQKLYNALADQFTTRDYKSKAKELNISEKTAERYVGNFFSKYTVVRRVRHGVYEKSNPQTT